MIKNITNVVKNLIRIEIQIKSLTLKFLLYSNKIDGIETLRLKKNRLKMLIFLNF